MNFAFGLMVGTAPKICRENKRNVVYFKYEKDE